MRRTDVQGRAISSEASEIDAVRVMTIHGSKGLEFSGVHLPVIAAGYMPSTRGGPRIEPPPSLIRLVMQTNDRDAEEECLFFVAMSRARDVLSMSLRAEIHREAQLKSVQVPWVAERSRGTRDVPGFGQYVCPGEGADAGREQRRLYASGNWKSTRSVLRAIGTSISMACGAVGMNPLIFAFIAAFTRRLAGWRPSAERTSKNGRRSAGASFEGLGARRPGRPRL